MIQLVPVCPFGTAFPPRHMGVVAALAKPRMIYRTYIYLCMCVCATCIRITINSDELFREHTVASTSKTTIWFRRDRRHHRSGRLWDVSFSDVGLEYMESIW